MSSRKVFMILASVACVILLTGGIITFDTERTILNPDFYIKSLDDADVYENLPDIISDGLAGSLEDEIEDLNADEIYDILFEIITPQWTKDSISAIISGLLNYINGDSEVLQGYVDMVSMRDDFIIVVQRDHPDLDSSTVENKIPDMIYLHELVEVEDLDDARSIVSFIHSLVLILILLAAALLIIIFVLGKDILEKLNAVGMVLFVSGGFITIISFVIGDKVSEIRGSGAEDALFASIINALGSTYSSVLLLHGAIILAIGTILIISAYVMKRNREKSQDNNVYA
ncbi:MAG: hypothetical protein ACXQS3_04540 [Candidatus Methanofastidiosia archaeon]